MLALILASVASAGPCTSDATELVEALAAVPSELRVELSSAWLGEVCGGQPALADAARMISQSPPDYRPMIDLKVIAEAPMLWMSICEGGLAVPQKMVQVAASDKRSVVWTGCALDKQGWFSEKEWANADGLVGIALSAGKALKDSGMSDAEVRLVVRGLAGIGGGASAAPTTRPLGFMDELVPVEVFEPYEGQEPDPTIDLGGGVVGGGLGTIGGLGTDDEEGWLEGADAVEPGKAGFVERPSVRWKGEAKRSSKRVCKVEITVRKSGEYGKVEWLECPAVLRASVLKALEKAQYTPAVQDGVAVRATFRTRFTVR